jgi:uncharacterized membrane protein
MEPLTDRSKANAVGNRRPLVAAGLLLGVGMGGFVDGILLHQLLQWHNMLASVLPVTDLVSSKVNMFWDGMFHAFTWLTTFAGLLLLFRAGARADVPWSGRIFAGTLIGGWGLFNLVEGASTISSWGCITSSRGRTSWPGIWDFLLWGCCRFS